MYEEFKTFSFTLKNNAAKSFNKIISKFCQTLLKHVSIISLKSKFVHFHLSEKMSIKDIVGHEQFIADDDYMFISKHLMFETLYIKTQILTGCRSLEILNFTVKNFCI